MFDKYAGRLYDFTARNKRPVQALLCLLIVLSLLFLYFVEFESSMDNILPDNEVITRSMEFFRDSSMAGKVVISLGLNSPEKDTSDLIREADLLAGSLDKNIFTEVTAVISEADFGKGIDAMINNLPEMISEKELAQTDAWITREYVSEKLHDAYLQLLKPQGILMNSMLRSDPLGMRMFVLNNLKTLSSSTGYDVEIKDGHLISRDGRHALLIAKTAVPVTDSAGSKKLLASLNMSLEKLPAYISADIICGHTHTISNETLIKRDVNFISIFAAALLIVLYLFVIRDFSAVFIFLVPVAAILFAIDLSYLFFGKISYWVIGLGSTVAGITIDYGTHVYFAARGKSDPAPFVKHMIRPVIFGALTTIAIFVAFFFSGIRGYHQLAVLAIFSVILSAGIAVFVLPHIIAKPRGGPSFTDRFTDKIEKAGPSGWLAILTWVLLTGLLMWASISVEFEKDIKKLDGTERDIILAEERFRETWGGENTPAVIVVNARDYETALKINERVYRDAVQTVGAENFTSAAPLLPSEKTRKGNSERWNKFWTAEKKQKLHGLLLEEGKKYGFSENAFVPFFEGLEASDKENPPLPPFAKVGNTPLTPLDRGKSPPLEKGDEGGFFSEPSAIFERFIQKTDDGYRIVSYFPDTEMNINLMDKVSAQYPDTYLVSATVLSSTLSKVVSADLTLMTWISAISVIVMTYLCFFNLRETLIALVPPLTGVIWLFGFMSLLGFSINAANMIAGILAIGLASDYGIFMTYRSSGQVKAGTVLAIILCTVTTLIGAGVLIFAKHPALSSVGMTMVIGVGAGFLSSIFVVPKLCDLTVKDGRV